MPLPYLLPRRPLALALLALLATAGSVAAQPAADYRFADSVALALPADRARTVQTLAAYFRENLPDEGDRARAIYRWMTENIAYDAATYFRGSFNAPDQSAASVLRRRTAVCQGYSVLFATVATQAGLEAVPVIGQAKAFSDQRGQPFRIQEHTWNAVRVHGRWRVLDASWGAGDMVGRQFVRRPRDYYFDTPPEKLIFSHRARDPEWQFLDRPLSDRDFARLPFTHQALWELGFSVDVVREAASQPGFSGFAGTFPPADAPVRVEDAPVVLRLVSGQPYTFRLHAPAATEVIAVSGQNWQPLARDGNTFSGTAVLDASELVVMVRYPNRPEGVVVLRYEAGTRRAD